jgi:hypothetical protein
VPPVMTEIEVRVAWKQYQAEYAERRAAAYQTAARALQAEAGRTSRFVNSAATLAAAQAAGRAALLAFDKRYPEVGSSQEGAARDMWDWASRWRGWEDE